jgi:hypothetical protein
VEPDVVARVIGIAALVIALGSIGVTWWLWARSGPQLKIRLSHEKHPSDRLRDKLVVQVMNIGRMPILVKEMGIEDRVPTGQGSATSGYIGLSLVPSDSGSIPRVLEHTDLPLRAEADMAQIIQRWAADRKLLLVAWAKDGNDRKKTSRQVTVRTPRLPST